MKKKLILITALMLLIAAALFAVGGCSPFQFTVMYIADSGGTISGQTIQIVARGGDGEIVTAVADDGFVFTGWSDGVTEATRREDKVTKDIRAVAQFERIRMVVQYHAGANGSINGETLQNVDCGGDTQHVTAVPDEGYMFTGWSDGVTTATRCDREITADKEFTAIFKRAVKAKYNAGANGYLNGVSDQTIEFGTDTQEVTAMPRQGYAFSQWSDGVTTATRQDREVTSAIEVTAEYEFLFADGKGTEAEPFLIDNYRQLIKMSAWPASNYKLTRDLDLSGINHSPICDDATGFYGIFDGGGYTIRNMTVDTYAGLYPSLIGVVGTGGIVKNLKMTDSAIIIPPQAYYIGFVAGVSMGMLEKIEVSGIIRGEGLYYDGVAVGGLVGIAYRTVRDCKADITIELSDVWRKNNTNMDNPFCVGGLIGVSGPADISSSGATGRIAVTQSDNHITAGGLAGYYCNNLPESVTAVTDSAADVEITGDSPITAGGFIGRVRVDRQTEVRIKDCSAKGNLVVGWAAGFLYKSLIYGEFSIVNSHSDSNIKAIGQAAGFVYKLDKGTIINCYSTGDITADGYASGFCLQAYNVDFLRCYTTGSIKAGKYGSGFVFHYMGKGNIEQCFSAGTLEVGLMGGGFAFTINKAYMVNCYSTCDIIVTNTDPDNSGRTLVGGFLFGVTDSEVKNCYYAGSVTGSVYSEGQFGVGYIVGAFAGVVRNVQINNCHILHADKEYAPDIITENRNETPGMIDLLIYDQAEDMYSLADMLNEDPSEPMWENVADSFPRLLFR